MKVVARKLKHTINKLAIIVDNIGSSSGVDNEMNINYASDELGSLALLIKRRNQSIQNLRWRIWIRITSSNWDWSLYHLMNLNKTLLNGRC